MSTDRDVTREGEEHGAVLQQLREALALESAMVADDSLAALEAFEQL
jgi:hypothetical protein